MLILSAFVRKLSGVKFLEEKEILRFSPLLLSTSEITFDRATIRESRGNQLTFPSCSLLAKLNVPRFPRISKIIVAVARGRGPMQFIATKVSCVAISSRRLTGSRRDEDTRQAAAFNWRLRVFDSVQGSTNWPLSAN